jgi:hypothetical protein
VPDDVFERVWQHFDETQLVALTFALVVITAGTDSRWHSGPTLERTSRRALHRRDRIADPLEEAKGAEMATLRAIDEADIRQRMDKWAEAIRTMDLDGVTSTYAPDIASFDLGPPLRHAGAEAKEKNWVAVFAIVSSPVWFTVSSTTLSLRRNQAVNGQ